MNILGLGIDATDIPRIASAFERYGERFLRRVFTDGEIAYCTQRRNPVPHLAGRPLWQLILALYTGVTFIVLFAVALVFVVSWFVTGAPY